jgi:hypothetical protein
MRSSIQANCRKDQPANDVLIINHHPTRRLAVNNFTKNPAPHGQSLEQTADYAWVLFKILSAVCLTPMVATANDNIKSLETMVILSKSCCLDA